jgi:hypothetical protein
VHAPGSLAGSHILGAERFGRDNRQKRFAKAAEQQAVANAKAIAASIEPFYGAAAKDGFFKLLAGHYGAVKASKANPYLPKDTVQGFALGPRRPSHPPDATIEGSEIYEAEARTWEEIKQHVYQIADATANALAKQFAKKFS